jgi:hypothetical protein
MGGIALTMFGKGEGEARIEDLRSPWPGVSWAGCPEHPSPGEPVDARQTLRPKLWALCRPASEHVPGSRHRPNISRTWSHGLNIFWARPDSLGFVKGLVWSASHPPFPRLPWVLGVGSASPAGEVNCGGGGAVTARNTNSRGLVREMASPGTAGSAQRTPPPRHSSGGSAPN